MINSDEKFMQEALRLAKKGCGRTKTNPLVGAVIVKKGCIIARGYHARFGGPHAEIVALKRAGKKARGATLYVTLEPCSTWGKTPPCTEGIIKNGIKHVIIAMIDPNPQNARRGVRLLRRRGIKVTIGILKNEAEKLNAFFFTVIQKKRPHIILKLAQSLDGKIATRSNQSKWISNEEARKYVHSVRHIVDAIVIGVNTVLIDNPRLTARGCCGKGGNTKSQPLRIIVDSKGRTPLDADVLRQPGETLIATVKPMDIEKKEKFIQAGVEVLELPAKEGKVDVEELSKVIAKRGIVSVLVEGGSALLGSFFDGHLVDKILVFISPIVIGGDGARAAVGGNGVDSLIEAHHLSRVDVRSFGDNILVSGYVER